MPKAASIKLGLKLTKTKKKINCPSVSLEIKFRYCYIIPDFMTPNILNNQKYQDYTNFRIVFLVINTLYRMSMSFYNFPVGQKLELYHTAV